MCCDTLLDATLLLMQALKLTTYFFSKKKNCILLHMCYCFNLRSTTRYRNTQIHMQHNHKHYNRGLRNRSRFLLSRNGTVPSDFASHMPGMFVRRCLMERLLDFIFMHSLQML
jgi:hypothetical protein